MGLNYSLLQQLSLLEVPISLTTLAMKISSSSSFGLGISMVNAVILVSHAIKATQYYSRKASDDLTRDLTVLSCDFAVKIKSDFCAKQRPQISSIYYYPTYFYKFYNDPLNVVK